MRERSHSPHRPSVASHRRTAGRRREKDVSFNVTAQGNNLIYQWQEKIGGNWQNIEPSDNNEGVAASVFTYKDISSMTGPVHLRCMVSIANDGCPPLPSGESTLSIM